MSKFLLIQAATPVQSRNIQTNLSLDYHFSAIVPTGGMLRIPMWGYGGPNLDMALAYEKAAAQVLAARPTYLVFAQGLMAGRDLRLVKVRPLVLRKQWPQGEVVKGQLVYEVHEYPFLW